MKAGAPARGYEKRRIEERRDRPRGVSAAPASVAGDL
jgi:hypothetical protein